MKKTHNIDFTSRESGKKTMLRIFFIVIAAIVFGALSFVVLLAANDFDTARFFGTRAAEETTGADVVDESTEPPSSAPAFSDENSVNFLLICCDSDRQLDFCDVICVSYAENVIRVKPVSPELTLEYNGAGYTLGELFQLSSTGAVRDALMNKGIGISRYICVNETNFKMILQKLGPVELLLKNEVSFSVDAIRYSLPAGLQSMTSDTLLKYMKFASEGDDLLSLQAEALAQILRTYFIADNVDRGEDYFASLINLVDSDISAFDYTENRAELSSFLAEHPPVNVIN